MNGPTKAGAYVHGEPHTHQGVQCEQWAQCSVVSDQQRQRHGHAVPVQPTSRDWPAESVLVCTPHRPDVTASFCYSLVAMFARDVDTNRMMVRGGGPVFYPAGPMNLPEVRNRFCAVALDVVKADWLLMIDADAGFDPDLMERLVEAADPVTRPVVGALSFMVNKMEADDKGGWRWNPQPTLYNWGGPNGEPGFFVRYDYPDNTLVQVGATGCHALLIHRNVLEALRLGGGDTWFTRTTFDVDKGILGEDFSFCARVNRAGFPVYVHTGVKTTHQQVIWLGEANYQDALLMSRLGQLARAEAALQPPEGVKVDAPPQLRTDGWSGYREGRPPYVDRSRPERPTLESAYWTDDADGDPVLFMEQLVDRDACVTAFGVWVKPMWKHAADLQRYASVIQATRPEVIVECGTYNGETAEWFAQWGECEVITVDVRNIDQVSQRNGHGLVRTLRGSSTDPAVFARVKDMVGGRPCMVSLDSDHSRAHVLREIELYRELVTPGCHLVVEDGVLAWITDEQRRAHACHYDGDPLQAITQAKLDGLLDGFDRDEETETLTRVTMFPAGWWKRRG